jgi:hypothetical protein
MRHIFFDSDNIAIVPPVPYQYQIQGEISGVEGEAFRVFVDLGPEAEAFLQRATKLVVRPNW